MGSRDRLADASVDAGNAPAPPAAGAPGDVLAWHEPSDSGKASTLRADAGLCRPKAGRVVIDGEAWFDSAAGSWMPPHRRRVGLVFQSYALFPHLTALD